MKPLMSGSNSLERTCWPPKHATKTTLKNFASYSAFSRNPVELNDNNESTMRFGKFTCLNDLPSLIIYDRAPN